MRSNYKKLGGYIRPVDRRNNDGRLGEDNLYGISVTKEFIATHANLIGVAFDGYKVVAPRQFAYIPDTSRRGDKIAISLNMTGEEIIVSSICSVFEIVDENQLLPEYLMLWFMRSEFDRYARFMSNGSAREVFDWDCMCGVELPVPPIPVQRKIVHDYQIITDRIELLRKINENLEETTQVAFNNTFIKFSDSANLIETKLGLLPAYVSVISFKDINVRVENGARPAGGACDHGFPSLGADCAKGLGCYDETKAKYVPEEYAQKMKRGIVTGYELLVYKDGGTPSNFIPDFSIYGEGYPFDRFAINEHVFIIDFGSPASNWFAYFLFKSKYVYGELAALGGKSAIPGISQSDLEELYLIDPTCDIAKSFGNKYLPFLKTILINCKEILSLNKLQKSILSSIAKGA